MVEVLHARNAARNMPTTAIVVLSSLAYRMLHTARMGVVMFEMLLIFYHLGLTHNLNTVHMP